MRCLMQGQWAIILAAPLVALAGDEGRLPGQNAALVYWQAFLALEQHRCERPKAFEKLQPPLTGLFESVQRELEVLTGVLTIVDEANRRPYCDWGLDLSQGPLTRLPHVQECRYLARIEQLAAMGAIRNAQPEAAVRSLAGSFLLGRRVGADPFLISLIAECAVETETIDVAASLLDELAPADRKSLVAAAEPWASAQPLAPRVDAELRFGVLWFKDRLRDDPMGKWREELGDLPKFTDPIEAQIDQLDRTAEALRRIAALVDDPRADPTQIAAIEQAAQKDNEWAKTLMPSFSTFLTNCQRMRVKEQMFLAATRVLDEGDSALQATRDPAGSGPFTLEKVPGGFELRSKLSGANGQPLVLRVGKPRE